MSTVPNMRFNAPARLLHWTMALLVPVQIVLGLASESLHDARLANALLLLHYQIGMLLLALLAVRIAWRVASDTPTPAQDTPAWQRHTARIVHHVWGAWALMAVAGLHVGAAAWRYRSRRVMTISGRMG